MSKIRLHKLAEELGTKSNELAKIAEDIGMGKILPIETIDLEQAEKLKKAYKMGTNKTHPVQQNNEKAETNTDKSMVKNTESLKKMKKKRVYVFDNKQQSGSYSSDQTHAYVPKQIRGKKQDPKPQVQYKVAAEKPQSAADQRGEQRPVNKTEQHRPEQQRAEQRSEQRSEQRGEQRTHEQKQDQRAGQQPSQKALKAQIGQVSNVEVSRPMPLGRPSSTVGATRRPPAEGRKSQISSARPPAPGRPSRAATGAAAPARDGGSKGAAVWKKKEPQQFVVEEEITKSVGKRKGQKKKDAPVDKDKLEKKSKTAKKKTMDFSGDFDFGKKRKQKSQRYKALQSKERSERLDEMLQRETVYIPEEITVKEFAEKINKSGSEIIMKLVRLGKMVTINNVIDYETAALIAMDYEIELDIESDEGEDYAEVFELDFDDAEESLTERAPVVTVMGHVDHGKTSLLDAIRNTGIADGEAGGITQHIGASEVVRNDKKILFLDTPGHEAFSTLRARGAQITDIAVLVVAADDGVMPQTIEAIDHSKAAGVPIIVAINKIDKPAANPDRVKQELSERGLVIEEWGGDVIAVPVSAKSGEGIDKLLDMILIVAEVQDLKANPNRSAVGTVIDAKIVKGRGVVTTVLVEKGTLSHGDNFVAGRTYGRVKTMTGSRGQKIKKVGPSTCVEIDGISDIPNSGEKFYVTPDEKTAKLVAEQYENDYRRRALKSSSVRLEQLFDKIKDGSVKELSIIIKADVQGSVEALKTSLVKLSTDEVKVNIIRADVGTISESDVILASASNALIIGFNVRPSNNVSALADSENVDIRTYNIIYQAIDDVENALKGMLDPIFKEVVIGKAEVRSIFKIPGGVVAGSYITSGKITRNAGVRVVRDGIVLYTGKITSLRRFKDDVKEVASGYECGIGIEKYSDIKEGDELEAFVMEEVQR